MSLFDSNLAPGLIVLVGFAFLAGFFRKIFVKVVIILAVEVIFLALFPKLLLQFVNLVSKVSSIFH
jgi:hypothetical protein